MNNITIDRKTRTGMSSLGYMTATPAQREHLFKAIKRRIESHVNSLTNTLAKEFRAQQPEVMKKVRGLSIASAKRKKTEIIFFNMDKWTKRIAKAAEKDIFLAAQDGYVAGSTPLKGYGYLTPMTMETKAQVATTVGFVDSNDNIQDWLKDTTLRFSKNINESVQRDLNRIVKRGIKKGGTITNIQDHILDGVNKKYTYLYGKRGAETLTAWQARRMALTASAGAQNSGHLASLVDSGVVRYKAWISARNGRVRSTHATADGRYTRTRGIPLNENFVVGAATINVPGNLIDGDVAEIINCHCALIAAKKGVGSCGRNKRKGLAESIFNIKAAKKGKGQPCLINEHSKLPTIGKPEIEKVTFVNFYKHKVDDMLLGRGVTLKKKLTTSKLNQIRNVLYTQEEVSVRNVVIDAWTAGSSLPGSLLLKDAIKRNTKAKILYHGHFINADKERLLGLIAKKKKAIGIVKSSAKKKLQELLLDDIENITEVGIDTRLKTFAKLSDDDIDKILDKIYNVELGISRSILHRIHTTGKITLYRGVNWETLLKNGWIDKIPEKHIDMLKLTRKFNSKTRVATTNALGSWTTNKREARKFGRGIILEMDADVESIFTNSDIDIKLKSLGENENIILGGQHKITKMTSNVIELNYNVSPTGPIDLGDVAEDVLDSMKLFIDKDIRLIRHQLKLEKRKDKQVVIIVDIDKQDTDWLHYKDGKLKKDRIKK